MAGSGAPRSSRGGSSMTAFHGRPIAFDGGVIHPTDGYGPLRVAPNAKLRLANPMPLLDSHEDRRVPVLVAVEAWLDEYGLAVAFDLDDRRHADWIALATVWRGLAMSASFQRITSEMVDGVQVIHAADIEEVSLCLRWGFGPH